MRFATSAMLLILLLTDRTLYAQPAFKSRLDAFFATQPANQPGFALSIEKNGQLLYRNAVGLADTTTRTPIDSLTNFRMASVTKQFTAMGILLLEKDGLLNTDDRVGRWLPELPAGVGQHVRIRHLLTHSSGILDYESLIPATQTTQVLDADVLRLLSQQDSTYFTPGSRFQYSNSGFCLLALIIERASKKSYSQFIHDRIFAPLHMDSSTIYEAGHYIPHRAMGYPADQSITSATKGDGGVYTSIVDYSKWIKALQQNKLLNLSQTLHNLQFPIDKDSSRQSETARAQRQTSAYAAGWFIQQNLLFHSGSTCGFNNFVIQLPTDRWTIVCFSNNADNKPAFQQILRILKETGTADLSNVFSLDEKTR